MEYRRISDCIWFLEKLWRLYYEEETLVVTDEVPTKDLNLAQNH
jgi:hypothetical protein